jgi:prepilin-type N-terminal cleavage/methylation domain-containing protein
MLTRRPDRGFTLVELMIVISIIGMLVMLLVPVISSARLIAAKASTTDIIRRLGMGLEAYKSDFGEYPPSRPQWSPLRGSTTQEADRKKRGTMHRGAANLVWYLAGPGGNGWGVDAAGRMPYDGLNASGTASLYTATFMRATRSYGPYFKTTSDAIAYEQDSSGQTVIGAILDGFKPAGKILYFRYEANTEIDQAANPPAPKPNYQVSDNNATMTTEDVGDQDPQRPARKNYYSQLLFLEAVRVYVSTISSVKQYRYVRDDYLLASPGPDGFYGWSEKDANGLLIPVTRTKKVAMGYDDITNW